MFQNALVFFLAPSAWRLARLPDKPTFVEPPLYIESPTRRTDMSEAKPVKAVPAVDAFGLNSPAKAAQNKKNRDERRKAIRSQNARSRVK